MTCFHSIPLVLLATLVMACSGKEKEDSGSSHPGGSFGAAGLSGQGDAGGTSNAAAGGTAGEENPTGAAGTATATGGAAAGGNAPGAGGNDNAAGRTAAGATGAGGDPVGAAGGSDASSDAGVLDVCPGASPVPAGYPPCRTDLDCSDQGEEYFCEPDPIVFCEEPPPEPECFSDLQCEGGEVCVFVALPDCDGPVNHCAPPCPTTECGADEVCGFAGHCQPKPCSDGYTCPKDYLCEPTRFPTDLHGCAPASCSTDGHECPDGFRCDPGSAVDVHGCADISCTDGYECPPNFVCNPDSPELHHCDRITCTDDAECDCGACAQGYCFDRVFICSRAF